MFDDRTVGLIISYRMFLFQNEHVLCIHVRFGGLQVVLLYDLNAQTSTWDLACSYQCVIAKYDLSI